VTDARGPMESGAGAGRRVLWVNHFAKTPREGGGTRHYEIGRWLVEQGWSVTIAGSDFHIQSRRYTRRAGPQDRSALAETVDGVEFRWLWAAPYLRNDWRRAWNWASFGRSLVRDAGCLGRPDVVIGSSPHLFAAAAAERLARRWRVPFVLEVRDLWPETLAALSGRKGPGYHFFDGLARRLYRRADRIVCLARGSMSHLERRGVDPAKLVYVPNGVDPDAFVPAERPERDTFTLVYAGAHGTANALDVVLDAAGALRDDPRIRFRLVGDGPEKQGLVDAARARGLANVEFQDSVPKSRMPEVFAAADAGLMVLRDTPLFAFGVSPNKLFDYLGAGLPVVCNVPGEVAEMVRAANAGEQAADGSAAALADAVRRLAARSGAERAEMGRAGREWVVREHGRAMLAGRVESMLQGLLSR
jgi:glycosyltransferase involved in cell wall biosynthesis